LDLVAAHVPADDLADPPAPELDPVTDQDRGPAALLSGRSLVLTCHDLLLKRGLEVVAVLVEAVEAVLVPTTADGDELGDA
jgi:hypothetical protein